MFAAKLIDAANEIDKLLVEAEASPEQADALLVKGLIRGCKTLTDIMSSPTFRTFINSINVGDFPSKPEGKAWDIFLQQEKILLINAGVSEELVDRTIDEFENEYDPPKNAKQVLENVDRLRIMACSVKDVEKHHKEDIEKRPEASKESGKNKMSILKRVGNGIFGIAIISVNSSSLVVTMGIPITGIETISYVFGANLIRKSIG